MFCVLAYLTERIVEIDVRELHAGEEQPAQSASCRYSSTSLGNEVNFLRRLFSNCLGLSNDAIACDIHIRAKKKNVLSGRQTCATKRPLCNARLPDGRYSHSTNNRMQEGLDHAYVISREKRLSRIIIYVLS